MRDLSSGVCPPRVYAVCGFKKSGKTTLMVELVRELRSRGLSVGAIKTDAHGLRFDGEGTDSDRLFRAGAEVEVRGPEEDLLRRPAAPDHRGREGLEESAARLAGRHDLVLVEGGKGSSLPKVWLEREGETGPPPGVHGIERRYPWSGDRVPAVAQLVNAWLERDWAAAPVAGGVLGGGASRRMGTPKESLLLDGATLLERTGALLGSVGADPVVRLGGRGGPWPVVPDPPGLVGPLAGLTAALRWAPGSTWLIAACDLPRLDEAALAWILAQRRPGTWAVIPRAEGRPQPLLAVYEPMLGGRLQALAVSTDPAPTRLAGTPRILEPEVPADLLAAFRGANTPGEWRRLQGR